MKIGTLLSTSRFIGPRGSSRREVAIFGVTLGTVLAAVLGTLVPLLKGRAPVAWLIAPGCALALLGLGAPAVLVPIHRVWMAASRWIGRAGTAVLLVGVYTLIFIPLGLIFRLKGRDPLKVRFDRERSSYWETRKRNEWTCRRYSHPF